MALSVNGIKQGMQKATKGTPAYDLWLSKFRAKRPAVGTKPVESAPATGESKPAAKFAGIRPPQVTKDGKVTTTAEKFIYSTLKANPNATAEAIANAWNAKVPSKAISSKMVDLHKERHVQEQAKDPWVEGKHERETES